MAKMKAQEKSLLAKDAQRKRKERTRRLIQIGAIAEKYFDCVGVEAGEFEARVQEMVNNAGDNLTLN